MLGALSVTPYYYYICNEWAYKKKKLKTLINSQKSYNNKFYSDLDSDSDYIDEFIEIFSEEINSFGTEVCATSLKIKKVWSVEYSKYDYHEVHTHGDCDFSAILYVDFNKNLHPSTHFLVENIDPISKKTIINKTEFVEEGGILFFPSNILHYSNPNQSSKKKVIVSCNIDIL